MSPLGAKALRELNRKGVFVVGRGGIQRKISVCEVQNFCYWFSPGSGVLVQGSFLQRKVAGLRQNRKWSSNEIGDSLMCGGVDLEWNRESLVKRGTCRSRLWREEWS